MKMPWGKFKGEELEDIPTDYLEWILREAKHIPDALAEEIDNQIRMRAGQGVSRGKAEGR